MNTKQEVTKGELIEAIKEAYAWTEPDEGKTLDDLPKKWLVEALCRISAELKPYTEKAGQE